jgi:hypothetical protein
MNLNNKKAVSANTAPYKSNLSRNNKRFPAFGKELFELRCAGKVPTKIVQVVFSWHLAKAWPRLVITDDALPSELDFRCLAGLPVQISYHNRDAHRIDSLVQEILKVRPSWLATFALDLVGGDVPAYAIIKPLQQSEERVAA